MLADSQESFHAQLHEPHELFCIRFASHDINHFLAELERRIFEFEIAAWRNVENEPEVDVYNVPFVVHQNVSVVAILNLEDVGDDGIGCHTLYKIAAGGLEGETVFGAIPNLKDEQIKLD
jgi:hypothetical protein